MCWRTTSCCYSFVLHTRCWFKPAILPLPAARLSGNFESRSNNDSSFAYYSLLFTLYDYSSFRLLFDFSWFYYNCLWAFDGLNTTCSRLSMVSEHMGVCGANSVIGCRHRWTTRGTLCYTELLSPNESFDCLFSVMFQSSKRACEVVAFPCPRFIQMVSSRTI